MTIGIVGLGLIGGSFAKAYSDNDEHKVLAYNRSKEVIHAAYNDKAIDGELNEGNIKDCDLILLCLYPQLCIDYLTQMAPHIRKDAMVIDCCGTKELICEKCFPIARKMPSCHWVAAYEGEAILSGDRKTFFTDQLLRSATVNNHGVLPDMRRHLRQIIDAKLRIQTEQNQIAVFDITFV